MVGNLRRRSMLKSGATELVDTSLDLSKYYACPQVSYKQSVTGAGNTTTGIRMELYRDSTRVDYWNVARSTNQDSPETREAVNANVNRLLFSLNQNTKIENSYLYWTDNGQIIYAGVNTKYYGMSNIDGTLARAGWTGDRPSI